MYGELSRRSLLGRVAATASGALVVATFPSRGLAYDRTDATRHALADANQEPPHNVDEVDVEYRRDGQRAWLVRIYQPNGSGSFPAVVAVHGGTWTDLDRTSDESISRALAASGIVVAAVDFRVAPADPYPAAIADINFATRWLKAHAADYSVDPRAIGGFGSSSGGHIVMLSAMRPHDERYTALPFASGEPLDASLAYVVLHSPVIDPVARYEYARATGRTDIWQKHDGFFMTMDAMRESDPRLILDGDDVEFPPTLVIHGSGDMNVPVMEVEDFAQAYRSAYLRRLLNSAPPDADPSVPYRATGAVLELEEFANLPHVFVNDRFARSIAPADRERAIQLIKSFITRHAAST
jgi:acetyl esterase